MKSRFLSVSYRSAYSFTAPAALLSFPFKNHENVKLNVFPRGLLQIDPAWPRMLKCSVVFTQSATAGLALEHNAAGSTGLYQGAEARLLTDC